MPGTYGSRVRNQVSSLMLHSPEIGSATMIAERLADYASKFSYADLPESVRHEVKRRLLDSLGCAFGAWTAAPCRIARRVAGVVKRTGGATIWGTGHRTLPDLAAFANGALVRY